MRFVALIVAAIGLIAAAPPEADILKFNHALAEGRRADATAIVDKLLRERDLGSGTLQPDPVLNALIGRVIVAGRQYPAAAAYLDRAPLAQLPSALRGPTAYDHALALEQTGERNKAIAAFAEAAALSTGPQRRSALYGQARLSLVDSPAAALNLLAQVNDVEGADRWQDEFLRSVASSLLGDRQSAERFAALSWQHSADAPKEAQAPLIAAVLRAGLAAAAGDIGTERAMLQISNGLVLRPSSTLTGQLPICGEQGVRPADFVTFAAVSAPYLGWRLVPVSASRPAAIAPFFDSIGQSSPFKDPGRGPVGTVFTLRCRSAVGSSYAAHDPADPLLTWMVDRGVYPATLRNESNPEGINTVVDRIDQISARFGPKSPLLIGARWQLMTMLVRSAAAGDEVQPGQVIDLSTAIAEGMRSEGAPAWLADVTTGQFQLARARQAAASNPGEMAGFNSKLRQTFLALPFDIARFVVITERSSESEMSASSAEMILSLNSRMPGDLPSRDRQSWLVAVAEAQKSLGRESQAKETLRKAAIAPDLCLASDIDPKLLEQKFSYSDYPEDLIAGEQEGVSTFDFNLAPDGKVASQRVILSFPANLFDAVSAKGLATVRYSAPKRNGKPASCRGLVQPIVWRLEDNQQIDAFPLFSRGVSAPTT
jgi:hypothetical protein